MVKQKLDNVGEEAEVIFEDFSQPDETTDGSAVNDPATPESEPAPTPEEDAQTEADLDAAGVNTSEKDAARARRIETTALYRDVKALGKAHGAGKTSMIGLAQRITASAMKRAIAPDDAGDIYDEFREAANTKAELPDVGVIPDAAVSENAPIETNDESRQTQVSKLRNFIELGNKFDETASELIQQGLSTHIKLLAGDRKTLMKGSTYTILVSLASANAKRKTSQGVMTEDEIEKHLYRAPAAETPKDGVAKLEQALEAVKAAKKGAKEREAILNPRLDDIISELRQAIGEEDPSRLAAIEAEEDEAEAERKRKEDAKNLREDLRNEKKANKKKAA